MQILSHRTLAAFWAKHPQAQVPLTVWYNAVHAASWEGPADVKKMFGANVVFVGDDRVVFDIAGKKYRLIVRVSCPFKNVKIKFVGTHAEYDKIDAETVG